MQTYPDYAKSPPNYLAAIVSVLSTYPSHVQERLCDLRTGIPAKCKFLPTVADIVEYADGGSDDFASARDLVRRLGRE